MFKYLGVTNFAFLCQVIIDSPPNALDIIVEHQGLPVCTEGFEKRGCLCVPYTECPFVDYGSSRGMNHQPLVGYR